MGADFPLLSNEILLPNLVFFRSLLGHRASYSELNLYRDSLGNRAGDQHGQFSAQTTVRRFAP